MTKQRMTIIRNNSYADGSSESLAYDQGWCDGYDSNEEVWAKQVLPIVGELEEHIRYDWEHNDCLQVEKIKMIFDVFWQYPPEHDWLQPLVRDAVEVFRDSGDDFGISYGGFEDLKYMAKKFGIPMKTTWSVAITYSTEIEVEADSEEEAIEKASEKFTEEFDIGNVASDAEFEGQEIV